MRHRLPEGASWVLAIATALCATPALAQERTVRISVGMNGQQPNGASNSPDISSGGRFVVFNSLASNLVPGDTNNDWDVFVVDQVLHVTERVSVNSSGVEANGASRCPGSWFGARAISSDGRFVVFISSATNLVLQDNNGFEDVFVRDRLLGTTRRVNVSATGAEANAWPFGTTMSEDGSTVAFVSAADNLVAPDTNGTTDVFVVDLASNTIELESLAHDGSQANARCIYASLNRDGSVLAFSSAATNMVPAQDLPGFDVFVRDRAASTTTRASQSTSGVGGFGFSEGPVLSSDGRFVAFFSSAGNLAPDVNPYQDAFLHDRLTGTTTLESYNGNGVQANLTSVPFAVLGSGRALLFYSNATNLIPGVSVAGVFLRDRGTGALQMVSRDGVGHVPGRAGAASITSDESCVVFDSDAPGFVPSDMNGLPDVFLRELRSPPARLYCETPPDSQGCLPEVVSSGRPSAYVAIPFMLAAGRLLNGKLGLLVYGTAPDSRPWGSGTRCVRIPFQRTAVQATGGSVGPPDCSGSLSFDFNARIRSGTDPALVPGAEVYAQFLYRDPGATPALGTTRGLHFTVLP